MKPTFASPEAQIAYQRNIIHVYEAEVVKLEAARDEALALLWELSEASWKVLLKYEWNGWGVTSPNGYDEALLADRTAKARALLSGPAETPEGDGGD